MNARERLTADARTVPVSYSTPCRERVSDPPYYLHEHQCSRNASWAIRGIRLGHPYSEPLLLCCTQHAVKWLDRLS